MAEKAGIEKVSKGGSLAITPVTILWDGVLMLPVTGMIDSKRVQEIMDAVLMKILDTQAKVVIMDIMGVASIDSAVANHIIKITKATQLMGCQCIITGISPEVAQTLVHLGVDLGGVATKTTIAQGLEIAFSSLGLEVKPVKIVSAK